MIFGFFSLLAFIPFHFGLLGLHFLSFWSFGAFFFGPSFPFILAFWAFISFHFGLLGLHFLSFWRFGLAFPCILAFWVFISLRFGLLGLHFLSFWPFGPSSPFVLALWWLARGVLPHSLLQRRCSRSLLLEQEVGQPPPQVAKNPVKFAFLYNKFNCPGPGSIFQFFAFCAFIFHFGLLGLYFLSLWPCGPLFPFILAFWAFISFHFGLLGLDFLSFWPSGPSFPFILALWAFISFHFDLLGLDFLPFWPSGPSIPFILALWAFVSFHFGLLGLHFLSFWPSGPFFRFSFVVASSWAPPHKLPKPLVEPRK